MNVAAQKETLGFQAEITQLMHLMVNALYSNKEIFLRELISNASDAADRLRFEAISDPALMENGSELSVWIETDSKEKTITIRDNGIGMSREEVIKNIGTIAKSGTKEFLQSLTGDQVRDFQLIGQFGVGFYSSFIVADRVTIKTRRAGLTKEHGVLWESKGDGSYTLENIEKESRGTEITLHLKSKDSEFAESWRLRNIILKYSDHIAIPIMMKKEDGTWERVNRATALWALPKVKIKDEEYKELYKHIAHDFEDPLVWSHNKVEGKLEYTSLLYIPQHAQFDLWQPQAHHGLKLYVNRVFIMEDVEHFLPRYLRFIRGIVDCHDLPLNISREILQQNDVVEKIRSGLVKRVLDMLKKLAKDDKEKYRQFWTEFGRVLKEGPADDFSRREEIAELLRFASTHHDSEMQEVSLEDYVQRMKSGQEKIYYITAESYKAAKNSPHLEVFRKKGIEVLLLSDRVDEWLVTHLPDYKGKPLCSVTKGDLDLGKLEAPEEKETKVKKEKDYSDLVKKMKERLGKKVKDVRLTERLTDSPACIVSDANDLNLNMQRILKSLGKGIPEFAPIFEVNPDHPIVQHLKNLSDDHRFDEWLDLLFQQAILAEGGQLEDPGSYVNKLNQFLLELVR